LRVFLIIDIEMSFFLVRHGERCDQVKNKAERARIQSKIEPPLTKKGVEMSVETGKFLTWQIQKLIDEKVISPSPKITILTSPFMRCIETATHILRNLNVGEIDQTIHFENGVCELLDPSFNFKEGDFPANLNSHKYPERVRELIGDQKLDSKGLFDPSKYTQPRFPENIVENIARFESFFRILLQEKYKDSQEPHKEVYILVSHGAGVEALKYVADKQEYDSITYCSTTFAKAGKSEKNSIGLVLDKNCQNFVDHLKALMDPETSKYTPTTLADIKKVLN
jgi:broad specificity phosphatase PhoE